MPDPNPQTGSRDSTGSREGVEVGAMSFMVVECPWCGETYTFGIVGTQQIGSGHTCGALVDCIEKGCDQPGRYLVAHGLPVQEHVMCCLDHIGDGVILGCQRGDPFGQRDGK